MLQVTLLPGKGRGYKALETIEVGTVVHVSEPLATTVSQEWTPETCSWCFDFSYPKKQKTRIHDQTQLAKAWNIPYKKDSNLFKDVLFCSEKCRDTFQQQQDQRLLAAYYRLDTEFKQQRENTLCQSMSSIPTVDIQDDSMLSEWLEKAWDMATHDLDLVRPMEDTDKAMCRLIAACVISKLNGTTKPSFDSLWVIQNNELSHFKSYCDAVPDLNQMDKQTLWSWLPEQVLHVMALYCLLKRAFSNRCFGVPVIEVDHALFRAIYFRERANSFGLWEMSPDGTVTDDLELLGWGIYPSAVYFNHACDANVNKIREGRQLKDKRPVSLMDLSMTQ
ncbi:hypothetical protein CU098_009104 [Rhizopus stolonifer]|uniref:SET domain-containing protein n=1 Tax=Rhizopus stolonifer TaxID=4846 RepID=A0A367KED1_RHIST|nr:hypothetical protein CU098_009104 [Rhizopus stolonifer]